MNRGLICQIAFNHHLAYSMPIILLKSFYPQQRLKLMEDAQININYS